MSTETRTRFMLSFGKAPGHEWYLNDFDELKEDYDRFKDNFIVETFKVEEIIDMTGKTLSRSDVKIQLH